MRKTEQAGLLAAVFLGVLLLALPLAAAPQDAAARPMVTEQISGTILGLTPQIAYESASLRVSGPADYSLTQRIPVGSAIAIDLLAEAGPRSGRDQVSGETLRRPGSWVSLPDGRYRYEVVFTKAGGERFDHSGVFFVEHGSAVSRSEMRARLSSVGEDLAEARVADIDGGREPAIGTETDWFAIVDGVNDGTVYLSLDSDPGSLYWHVANVSGDLEIHEDSSFSFPGTPRMTFARGGSVGIGTTAPGGFIHALTGSGSDLILESTAGGDQFIFNNDGDDELHIRSNSVGNLLSLSAFGGLGVGVEDPDGDFHLANVDATGDTVFKIANASEWNLGTTGTGVFTFNLAGSGGQEATFRARNDPVATLDVQGHVRGTSFKSTSSRAMKTAFEALDPADVLSRLTELPVTSWRYRTEAEETRHFGPVAEDFQRLFGLGDGRTISTVDADGVLMAALKGLNSKVEQQATELRSKDAEIDALKARLAAIERHLAGTSD